MKSKRWLVDWSIVAVIALLLSCAGVVAAWQMVVVRLGDRPWTRYVLPVPPVEAVNISRVAFHAYLGDPTGDTIYIQTRDNAFYFNMLYEDKWQPVDHPGYSQDFPGEECAPDWPGAESSAPIWKAPPVEKKVRDSAGFRYEPALAFFVRCYVLYDDGTLEVWSRYADATGLRAFLNFYGPAFLASGGLLGLGIGAVIVLIRHRRHAELHGPG